MIAVFTKNHKQFNELALTPKKEFIRISSSNSIRGFRFTGVMTLFNWYENDDVCDAYYFLKNRQPEIFKP